MHLVFNVSFTSVSITQVLILKDAAEFIITLQKLSVHSDLGTKGIVFVVTTLNIVHCLNIRIINTLNMVLFSVWLGRFTPKIPT